MSYAQKIETPKDAQEGLQNFVQSIINDLEFGMDREALLKAVDLKNDLVGGVYKVEKAHTDAPGWADVASGVNTR